MGDEYAVFADGVQVVAGNLDRRVAVAPVVVVPVLAGHEHRHAHTEQRNGKAASDTRCPAAKLFVDPSGKGGDSKAYPDGEGIEGAGIGIVPLTHLVRRLIEVYDYRDSGHEEEQEGHPGSPLVPEALEKQAYEAEQQRKEEIVVLARIVQQGLGSVPLVAQHQPVDEAYAALPVPLERIARDRTVYVVLAADEIPHEIAPVHPVELIAEEIFEILAHGRHLIAAAVHIDAARAGSAVIYIPVVEVAMTFVAAPHPREEHLGLGIIHRMHLASGLDVAVAHRCPVPAVLELVCGVIGLAVYERIAAVLLASQVAHQGVRVVRLVLVGRRLHRRPYYHY